MQNLVRSKTLGVTGNGGRGTAGAGPGRDLLHVTWLCDHQHVVIYQSLPDLVGAASAGKVGKRRIQLFCNRTGLRPFRGNLLLLVLLQPSCSKRVFLLTLSPKLRS